MLVLHPSTLMETDSPLGIGVGDGAGISVSDGIVVGAFVFVGIAVAMNGVEVATPMIAGVGVNMYGVGVGGRNGVGPGMGWIIQPLQDDNRSMNTIEGIRRFIFSPRIHCIPLGLLSKVPCLINFGIQELVCPTGYAPVCLDSSCPTPEKNLQLPRISPTLQLFLIFRVIIS